MLYSHCLCMSWRLSESKHAKTCQNSVDSSCIALTGTVFFSIYALANSHITMERSTIFKFSDSTMSIVKVRVRKVLPSSTSPLPY